MRQIVNSRAVLASLLTSSFLVSASALAQSADGIEEIVVTAQKREENLQSVPISIQAIGTKKLDQLGISNFNDYTKQLPSVAFQTTQPGSTSVYMRGVASGGDGNHSASLPSVGVYLDEQPVTTIGGTLDVHIYDIARIESLAGPQGTLYGASSQAGTIRIITNKPSTAGFSGRADAELNTVKSGNIGGKFEGMINAPLSDRAALRVVAFYKRNTGFIDNVAATRSFLGDAILDASGKKLIGNKPGLTVNNAPFVKNNINTQNVYGARAALKVDLDENWTVMPSVIAQESKSKGSFSVDDSLGDLQVNRFSNEFLNDRFIQAALTIEGKLSNWDVTYAAAYMDRKVNQFSDYSDYAEAYDQIYANYTDEKGDFSCSGVKGCQNFNDVAGNNIDSRQFILASDHFRKLSQELRVASPQENRLRVVAGVFYQRQSNDIFQDYQVPKLAPLLSVNGRPGTLWLTKQERVDKDYAMFGELAFDITPSLKLTAGGRAFMYDNSLIGFFGFGRNPAFVQGADGNPPPNAVGSSRTGVAGCLTTEGITLRQAQLEGRSTTLLPAATEGAPCTNLAGPGGQPKSAEGTGFTHKLNLSWKINDDFMTYATWSRGFRPGGINRRASIPSYQPDYLTNFEIGAKTSFGALRFNVAAYLQEWKKFQYSFLGENSFTQIQNGPDARIKGIEVDLNYNNGAGLGLSAAAAYTDAKTKNVLCAGATDITATCADSSVSAPKGTRLPITPEFKGSATARYEFALRDTVDAHIQAGIAYQSSASSDIRVAKALALGKLAAFTTVDFAAGITFGQFSVEAFLDNAFDTRGQISRFQQCGQCDQRNYFVPSLPRSFGLRAGAKF